MRASIDKFGRLRGGEPGGRMHLTSGMGLPLDAEGNYDMLNRRLTNVALPSHEGDAATMANILALKQLIDFNKTLIVQEIPSRLPGLFDLYIEKNKDEKIVPLIRGAVEDRFSSVETRVGAMDTKLIDTEATMEEFKTKKVLWEEEMKSIKNTTQAELKALSDMTRAFVYKVTSPSHQRKSEEAEKALREGNKERPWRQVFPEILDPLFVEPAPKVEPKADPPAKGKHKDSKRQKDS